MIKRILGNLIRKHYWKRGALIIPLNKRNYFEEYKNAIEKVHAKAKGVINSEPLLVYSLVKKTAKMEGLMTEVGVFQGTNANLICEAKESQRRLILFDTWEGLPEDTKYKSYLNKGDLKANLTDVKERLKDYYNVEYNKGLIEDTLERYKNNRFSLVFLDLDLYDSTKFALEFFYPRMIKGGILVTHDYNDIKDIKKAFNEFFKDKPEIIHETNETQAFIQKIEQKAVEEKE